MLRVQSLIVFILFSQFATAQKAKVTVEIKNFSGKNIVVWQKSSNFSRSVVTKSYEDIALVNGKAELEFSTTSPQFIEIGFDNKDNWVSEKFYLNTNDAIKYSIDLGETKNDKVVLGLGSENNQNLMQFELDDNLHEKFPNDSLPTAVTSYLISKRDEMDQKLLNYAKINKPTRQFVNDYKLFIKYMIAESYFSYKSQRKFKIRNAYERNKPEWEKAQSIFFSVDDLNKDQAINIPGFRSLVGDYILRTKEDLWNYSSQNKVKFFKEWYGQDSLEAAKLFSSDMENDLQERIAVKSFKNKTLELAYAAILNSGLSQSKIENLPEIYSRLEENFPKSSYVTLFKSKIDEIVARNNRPLNPKMVFAQADGKNLNSFEEVLAITKGKTLLLDMWGTWCAPCREEIEKNAHLIKKNFKDKNLDYLYIANYDETKPDVWKKLIGYFNLEGTHILANQKLTEDIMKKVKGEGYPTYVIIKKDGTYELSKAGYPMNLEKLYEQLNSALAMP